MKKIHISATHRLKMEKKSDAPECGNIPRAVYPPAAESYTTLGYLKDTNNFEYGRENGRCFTLGGRTYLTWGDSWVKDDDVSYEYIALNSVALVRDESKPFESSYQSYQENGIVNPLLAVTEAETGFTRGYRICLWSFGGVVEMSPGEGLMWYEIMGIIPATEEGASEGMGIAKIKVKNDAGDLEAIRCTDLSFELEAIRCTDLAFESESERLSEQPAFESESERLGEQPKAKPLIFRGGEPRFGSFSSILDGDFIYLWGNFREEVYLARVDKEKPHIRAAYEYWNGSSYVKDIKKVEPVFIRIPRERKTSKKKRRKIKVPKIPSKKQSVGRMSSGCFFKSSLFGEERPWVFVGCYQGSSKIMMGAEKHLEGPWRVYEVRNAPDHFGTISGETSCTFIFAHPWASNEETGELFITCSEQDPGGTLGAKLKLKMENRSNQEKEDIVMED